MLIRRNEHGQDITVTLTREELDEIRRDRQLQIILKVTRQQLNEIGEDLQSQIEAGGGSKVSQDMVEQLKQFWKVNYNTW